MVGMYCRDHHGVVQASPGAVVDAQAGLLCGDCAALLDYARARLDRCPYGAAKPTCAACPTHCYKPALREQVRAVMRFSGPRMLTRHPVLATAHLIDGRRRTPAKATSRQPHRPG
ncbi:MAG: nitrous oxide-stimulated promoter family protein [Actinobacteria bacterium]|nr:nitrous oxide-stimulated promoter family protein [Actinomycetota bacterium]